MKMKMGIYIISIRAFLVLWPMKQCEENLSCSSVSAELQMKNGWTEVWNFTVMSGPLLAVFLSVKSKRAVVFIYHIGGWWVGQA